MEYCCCSVVSNSLWPVDFRMPGFPVVHHLPELAQTHVQWVSDAIHSFCPLSSLSPPVFNLSSIRIFSNELAVHIRWPKYWSFSVSPSNEYSWLISFKINWFDLLVVQGTLKSLLQHHSSKASILWRLAFFMVYLSHSFMTTGKTIALTMRTFVGKIMSLLFNMLSMFLKAFLPRSKHLLIPWLWSAYAMILEPRKMWKWRKSCFLQHLSFWEPYDKWNKSELNTVCFYLKVESKKAESDSVSHSVMSDSLRPQGL